MDVDGADVGEGSCYDGELAEYAGNITDAASGAPCLPWGGRDGMQPSSP